MKTRRAEKERSILAPTLSNSPVCTVCAWARLYRLRLLLLLPPKKTRKGGNGHNDMVHISTSRAQSEHSHIPTGFSHALQSKQIIESDTYFDHKFAIDGRVSWQYDEGV